MSSPSPSPQLASPKRSHDGRHNSSWLARPHRQHDAKYQQEEQPLLSNDHPDLDTEAQDKTRPTLPSRWNRVKSYLAVIPAQIKRFSSFSSREARMLYQTSRRNIKQVLLTLILALVTLVIAFSVGFLTYRNTYTGKELCTSAVCIHAASELLYSISPDYASIDPCENFDRFACQGFEERHDLRPDQGDMFRGTIMAEDAEVTLRHILEGDASDIAPADQYNFNKLKADYTACMDEHTIMEQGLKPLKSVVEHIKMIYPATGQSEKLSYSPKAAGVSEKELRDAFLYMTKLGINPLFSVGVGVSTYLLPIASCTNLMHRPTTRNLKHKLCLLLRLAPSGYLARNTTATATLLRCMSR
jgi:Peptidase family M13